MEMPDCSFLLLFGDRELSICREHEMITQKPHGLSNVKPHNLLL